MKYTTGREVEGDNDINGPGPNDARRVVWALSDFFFSSYLSILTNVLQHKYMKYATEERGGRQR